MLTWQTILTVLGGLSLLVGLAVLVVFTYRAKSEDSWKKLAERRKADSDYWEAKCMRLQTKLGHLEADNELATQRASRDRGKLDWYELHYGPIPHSDIHNTRE